jgi:outer membrane protein OmpA-like peptidoglycan-associated protein
MGMILGIGLELRPLELAQREANMNTGQRVFLSALAYAAAMSIASAVAAQTAVGVPTQEEISRQLKFRGLPTLGTTPAPQPGPRSEVAPASVRPLPLPSREMSHQPVHSQPSAPSVTLRTITFEFGSAQLKPEAIVTLRNLGNALNQDLKDEKTFVIEGHTDKSGTRAYNDELSKRRADAVKDYLVREMGVLADRLSTEGKGFSELADPEHPYSAINRRVVVINATS